MNHFYEEIDEHIQWLINFMNEVRKVKILKQGKSKEEVERIIKQVRQFECPVCGCVFEADKTEYKYQFCQREAAEWWECNCPNCGRLTNKSIPTR